MKKGLCLILSAAFVAISFTACNSKEDNTSTVTKTNVIGDSYVEITDDKGNTVTNSAGAVVTSLLSDNEKSSIDAAKNNSSTKKDDKTTTTKKASSKTTTTKASALTTSEFNVTAAKDDLLPEGDKTDKTNLRKSVIENVISKGKFTLVTNIISAGTKTPATIAMDGDNLCVEMTASGIVARVLYTNSKMYFVIPTLTMYGELSGSDYSDLSQITAIKDNQTYVETTNVKDGSTTYTCETYKSDDGSISKYYFSGKTWKKWEINSGSDNLAFEISSFKNTCDSSIFSISGYQKIDLSSLGM